jgi:lipopolysaccharide/colanic/teichoic acid biosynthesis glycosyltransferase
LKYKFLKSFFDIFIAFFAIIVLLPFLAFIFTLLWINLKTNPIFVQIRPGYKGKLFRIYKFKTMRDANPEDVVGLTDFERITKIGGFLRKLSLDDLPQLFNVVFGQMSFVGPRPDLQGFADELIGDDRIILKIKPGVTGPATLKYKDEEQVLERQKDPEHYNRTIIWVDKVKINKKYVENYSFYLDLELILKSTLNK